MLADPLPALLIDSRAAALALSISARTLWELTARGELQVVRVGRLVRFSPADLATFVAARRQVATPAALAQ